VLDRLPRGNITDANWDRPNADLRREKLLELTVTLAARPLDGVYLVKVDRPTDEQQAAFKAWLGSPWDESEAKP
jgi:hypothetical protein